MARGTTLMDLNGRDRGMESFPEQAKLPVCTGNCVEKDIQTAVCAVSSHVLGHLSS